MSTAIKQFLNLLLPHVPGAPDVAAIFAIRRASLEFCQRSMVWRSTQTISIVANTGTYTVTADTDAAVFKVLSVAVSGIWIEPTQLDQLARTDNWKTSTASAATAYYQTAPDSINLWPTPTTAVSNGLLVQTAQQPVVAHTTIPDFIYNNFGQAIIDGSLSNLMATPGKEWTQPELAVYHKQQFEMGIATAVQQSSEQFGRAPIRVTAHN